MPRASADPDASRPRSTLRANLLALAALVVVGGALLLWQQPWRTGDPGAASVVFPSDAVRRIDQQLAAMSETAATGSFVEAAGSGNVAQTVSDALRTVGTASLTLRYLDGGQAPSRDDGTTTVTTRVAWAADGTVLPAGERRSTVVLRFSYDGERFVLAGAEPHEDDPLPLWLAGPVTVENGDSSTVVRVGDGAPTDGVVGLADRAAADVAAALGPDVADRVVVVAPASTRLLARLVGRAPDEAAAIAAVTTRLDAGSDAAAVIALNPTVFAPMDSRARQIVMTHEAVHQLTSVVGSPTEDTMWVVEGFADWVALREDDAGLEESAARILGEVRAEGPPERLPTRADFADAARVTAVYESAWLAIRMLVEQHGFEAVTEFYGRVTGGEAVSIDAALRETMGTDLATVAAQWRDYLTYNASTVS
ncbi:hypothetical protein D9V41_08530 [Aeromicrobium phragmitis]|uniref:Peptidase MA-like domain-containing protein n=1 Tax=Aeromicrobium phragmitis TaxID=2478914 RepID=A0A3L8PKK7_9ACTN|nr:hypothetical protein [Aeromicrobium phragmitis]RLV55936.1 hypothetical protein D9V41_08530 [Aeromicrobium phragmitis]